MAVSTGCNESGDPYGCCQYDRQLSDGWLGGFNVVGLEVGIGYGWAGSYISYADHITINDTTFDFEAGPAEVVLDGKGACFDGGWETSTSPAFKNHGAVRELLPGQRARREAVAAPASSRAHHPQPGWWAPRCRPGRRRARYAGSQAATVQVREATA